MDVHGVENPFATLAVRVTIPLAPMMNTRMLLDFQAGRSLSALGTVKRLELFLCSSDNLRGFSGFSSRPTSDTQTLALLVSAYKTQKSVHGGKLVYCLGSFVSFVSFVPALRIARP